jgi:hypothetical protein
MLPLISKCFFYIQVAEEFLDRKDELEQYIRSLYPEDKLILRWTRNDYTRDWRKLCEELNAVDDDLIWVACNDDHIFIDSSLEVIEAGLNHLKNDPDPMAVLYYSHWPEQMHMAKMLNGQLTSDGNYVKFTWGTYDSSIQVVRKERFNRYWFENDFGDELIFRPDEIDWKFHKPHIIAPCYSPTKEIARHYDGYGHVGRLNNFVSPLVVPAGFFEKNIKIRYGFEAKEDGYVTLNPCHRLLYAAHPDGIDSRWAIEDIPMCWKDRIAEIKYADGVDLKIMREARNHNTVACAHVPLGCFGYHFGPEPNDPTWFKKHFI